MPRNVRNWWISGQIDGRESKVVGGPQSRDGGFELTIKQREDGKVSDGVRVVGYALDNGTLRLEVIDPQTHQTLVTVVTARDLPGREIVIEDERLFV